ncbi:MAG: hypothetical protein ACFFA3_19425, partial [Promethearchaeota archaeon]
MLKEFKAFLSKDRIDVDDFPKGNITRFTEYLIQKGESEIVLNFLKALINYANFKKKYDYIIEIIDVSESYNAMNNLYQRVAEQFGENLRDEIFKEIEVP